MTLPPVVERDSFESDALGFASGRLNLAKDSKLRFLARESQGWVIAGYRLISCRVPDDWTEAHRALEDAGFRRIETLVVLERERGAVSHPSPRVRDHRADDCNECKAIAVQAFRHDRFHEDNTISHDAADRLKARWVENGFGGRAQTILVADEGAGAIGFALGLERATTAILDLIAVKPASQRRGLGTALLEGFLHRHRDQRVRVGTQENNYSAHRLYERAGFAVVARDATFHWTPPT